MMYLNPEETIGLPIVEIARIAIPSLPFVNVFGPTEREYTIEDTKEPNLLMEDGKPLLWEDGDNMLLEQQKVRIWQQVKVRK